MFDTFAEHCDFNYASDAEIDREGARDEGRERPESAWILSSRDVWYPNPFYCGPKVAHPEDDANEYQGEAVKVSPAWLDDMPF